MSNLSTLPNPDVYLNHLSPENAFAWELARNVYLVTCGALIWDILSSIPKDLQLFRRFNVGVLVYGICRPVTLAFVLTATISMTSPLPNCHAMKLGTTCSSIVASGTSSFLFLLRVQAVYSHSKSVKYAFFMLWLVQVGLSVLIPLGATSAPLYDTGYCINTGAKKSVIAASLIPPFFDTLVFGFISYRLVTTHANDSDHSHWRTFFLGKALPRLSKSMLQGGQQFYLLTVGMSIGTAALVGSSSIPKIYQIILAVPGIALTSVMACNVQRTLLFKGRQSTEQEPSRTVKSFGLSFTDILSVFTSSYRSQRSTNNASGHVEAQCDIPGMVTSPTMDLDRVV